MFSYFYVHNQELLKNSKQLACLIDISFMKRVYQYTVVLGGFSV